MDFKSIESKWQNRWAEEKIFETDPDPSKPKCFVTFPYPYMNSALHLGHAYTCTKLDIYARMRRMQGYNVLFPQGWHATGEPIQGVAKRISSGDEQQIKILLMSGVPREEIEKFRDPKYIIEYNRRLAKRDMIEMGYSIDWRREFITTTLTPTYSRFIEWQYNTFRRKGYVTIGTHPVIWCPSCKSPTGDHDRLVGEGVSPIEYTLLKFKYNDAFLIAATLRPETIYGVTNMWIKPDVIYVLAEVDGEKWIVSKETVEKLVDQLKNVKVIKEFYGRELIGKKCFNPIRNEYIYILPAYFIDPYVGTGVVMSVPSHAPYDYVALEDLKKNREVLVKLNINPNILDEIKPISMISVEGFGEHPAIKIVKKMGISSQNDERLEKATEIIYKREFHLGRLRDNCGKYAGKRVQEVKDKLIQDFKDKGIADSLWDPAEKVVCRCTTRCHVKILENQWFLKYSDPKWKESVLKHLGEMNIYPKEVIEAFKYTVEWLKDKPFTRKSGLGTPLPWDKEWIIETLSDSTIYMAYYTIVTHIKKHNIPPEKLTDEVFNYIFLGEGNLEEVSRKSGLDKNIILDMRKEFEYWYPIDLRQSGKDLIHNHLTFFLFHHIAIFRPEHWPRGIGVNGFIMNEGKKMSKRLGNFVTMRQALNKYGADVSRFALAYFGEGLDDADWRSKEVEGVRRNLESFYQMMIRINEIEPDNKVYMIDRWLKSRVNRIIVEVTSHFEKTETRSGIQKAFYQFLNDLDWYRRRRNGVGKIYKDALKVMLKLLAPVIPHMAEEIWEKWGNKTFISLSEWPKANLEDIDEVIEAREGYIKNLCDDIKEIFNVTGIMKAKSITIFTAPKWMYKIFSEALKSKENLMKRVMQDPEIRKNGARAAKYVNTLLKTQLPSKAWLNIDEEKTLSEEKEFLEKEFKCRVNIVSAETSSHPKAKIAVPFKPGIYVEK